MSDKDTSCYIYIPHGHTHCIATHFFFFPAIPTTEHGERSRVRAKKTAQRSCSGFFQIRTCEALDGFGVWSYLCRPKREKSFVIVMPLHLHDNDIYLFIVDAVYNSVMCGYMP